MRRAATLLGISVLWLPLAFAFDGVTVLVLPVLLAGAVGPDRQATALGLLSFGGLLAAVVAQPAAGALSDRVRPEVGRRRFIAAAAAFVLVGLALLATSGLLLPVVVGYVVVQVAAAGVQAGQQAYIPDLVARDWRGRAAGLKGVFDVGGAFVAFLVLGFLLAAGQTSLALVTIAGLFVVGIVSSVLLVDERSNADLGATGAARTPAGPLDSNATFVRLAAARFAFLFGIYAVGRFFVLLVANRLGLDTDAAAGAAGTILATLTLVTAATSLPAGWLADRVGRVPVMTGGAVAATIGIAGLAAANSEASLLLFGAFMGVGSGAFAAANWAMTADVVPAGRSGAFMGLANIGTGGAAAAAGLLGPVLDAAGPNNGFLLILSLAALATAASAVPLRGLGRPDALSISPRTVEEPS